MTEYDYSPGAREKYDAKLQGVGRWAAHSSSQASQYSHPFPGQTSSSHHSSSRTPSRSSTLPSNVGSTHSRHSSHSSSSRTVRAPSGTVISSSGRTRAMAPPSSGYSSLSKPPSSYVSRQSASIAPSSHSRMSGSSRQSHSSSRSGSHHSSRSGSHVSGSHLSGAPSLHSSTQFSGGGGSVAPSDSVSQAGSRSSRRSSTLPTQLPSGSHISSTGPRPAYGQPDHSTHKPFTANGYTIIPGMPGQRLDIYVSHLYPGEYSVLKHLSMRNTIIAQVISSDGGRRLQGSFAIVDIHVPIIQFFWASWWIIASKRITYISI